MASFNWNVFSNIKESFKSEDEKTEKSEKINEDTCIGCNSNNLSKYKNEKIICNDCGAVNKSILNCDKEWRYYGSDDNVNKSDPNRCGMPLNPLFDQSSLSIAIVGNKCFKFKKMNNWNGMSYKERKTIKILNKIKKIANDNHIPKKVVDQAIVIFNEISKGKIKRGKKLECILGSCFRLSLKYHSKDDKSINRSMEELSKLFNIKEKKLSKEFNELFEYMYRNNSKFIKNIRPTKPKDLIFRFCSLLKIKIEYVNICIEIIKNANDLGICQDNNPKSISVGCIYLVCNIFKLNITKKEISKMCDTSEVTILLIYHQLNMFKDFIIPKML